MESIENVIELVSFTEKTVSALLDCKEQFQSVMFRLNALKENEAVNARFEGLDETEIEAIKASERAEEIKALQEEAAEAFRLRKVLQVVSEKVEMEVETAKPLMDSIIEPTEPLVEDEVEPIESEVADELEPTEPVVENEVGDTKIVVEQEAPKKTVKKV